MGAAVALGAAIRWFDLVALAAVGGGLALAVLVLPGGEAAPSDASRRLERTVGGALAVLAVASLAELLIRAHTMAGGDLTSALAALPLVLRKTHFGWVWSLRACGLLTLAFLRGSRAPASRRLALVVALAIALTVTLTGHAADGGDATVAVVVDWLHVAAASVWAGGLLGLTVAVLPAARAAPQAAWVGDAARRFSRLAGVCAATVVGAGLGNTWSEIEARSALWTSPYGRVLAAKLALVLGILTLGAVNRYRVLPRFQRTAEGAAATRALATWVARETVLVLLVYGCTALLGQLAPPRHDTEHHAALGHVDGLDARRGAPRTS